MVRQAATMAITKPAVKTATTTAAVRSQGLSVGNELLAGAAGSGSLSRALDLPDHADATPIATTSRRISEARNLAEARKRAAKKRPKSRELVAVG